MFLTIKKIPKVSWSSEKPLNLRPKLTTFFFLSLGLILFGIGEGLLLVSYMGASPWSVFAQGISLHVDYSIGLITFFTTGPDETRAWSIRNGTEAQVAAGQIHSDIQRGFIRAEIISYEALIESGNESKARTNGLLRQEGKNYTMRDGDVVNFLFNV